MGCTLSKNDINEEARRKRKTSKKNKYKKNNDKNNINEKVKSKSRINEEDVVMLDIKTQISKVNYHIKRIEQKIEDTKTSAMIALKTNNKKKALAALRCKRMYEETINKNYGAIMMLKQAEINLESVMQDKEFLKIVKEADAITKELRSKASIADFEKLYIDIQDRQDQNAEINQMFSEMGLDDDDIKDELDKLGNENPSSEQVENIMNKLGKSHSKNDLIEKTPTTTSKFEKGYFPSSKKQNEKQIFEVKGEIANNNDYNEDMIAVQN